MRRGMKGFLTELTDGEENEESRKRVETKGVGTEEEITGQTYFFWNDFAI